MKHTKIKQVLLASALACVCASPAFAAVIYVGSELLDQNIPDNTPTGTSSTINTTGSGIISSLEVTVSVKHTWVGDLIYTLTHGTTTITLMNQPSAAGGSKDLDAQYPLIFSDSASVSATTIGAIETPGQPCTVIGGSSGCTNTFFSPIDPLSTFNTTDVIGDWTLNISDNWTGDTGLLVYWYIRATVNEGDVNDDNDNTVPEPATLALIGLAMAGMALSRRRRSA